MNFFKWSTMTEFYALVFMMSVAALTGAAYYQYALDMAPCVLCIEIRMAFILTATIGLIGMVFARKRRLYIALTAFFALSSWYGLNTSYYFYQIEHNQVFPSCSFEPNFKQYVDLERLSESFFRPTGMCSASPELVGSISMVDVSLVFFLALFAVSLCHVVIINYRYFVKGIEF